MPTILTRGPQPQLSIANMADNDPGTDRYSLFMQMLSTHCGFGVYMRYTSMFAFTEHRHKIHMSQDLQLDDEEETADWW